MKTSAYLVLKYWRKHKRNAAALMFSGVLTVAVVFVALMQLRGVFNRELHKLYDKNGMFDLQLPNASEETIAQFIDDDETAEYGYVYVLGKTGIGSADYAYGYTDDPQGLMHIPLESGVMPENDGEIAIDRGVLNKWNWAGTLGDSVTLENKTYSVVGIIDECYGKNRAGSELWYENIGSTYPIPLIYVSPSASEAQAAYKITLIGGFIDDQREFESCDEILHTEYGGQKYGYSLQFKDDLVHCVSVMDEFKFDTRWILILSGIAAQIAVLSVFSVLRSIFLGRRDLINILRRIGMSSKKIQQMYAIECAFFTVAQIIIGTALGAAVYAAINGFQVGVLGESVYSAFTSDVLVTSNTVDPFLVAACFGAVITAAAYLLTAASANQKPRKILKEKKPRSLRLSFSAVFRQRGVTVIQIISLALIDFGVMLGYMYYTRDGKEILNYLKYDYPVSYHVGKNDAFDLKEDGIAEYYTCGSPLPFSIQTYEGKNEQFVLANNNFKLGMNDGDVDKFTNVTASGRLDQTFVISDAENTEYPDKIIFREPEIEALVQFSSEEYKDFFENGQLGTKNLYRLSTLLTSSETTEKLSEYVVSGRIDVEALNNGDEIILVSGSNEPPYSVGETLHIGSAAHNDTSGIGDVVEADVVIGAVVTLPDGADKMLRYAVKGDGKFNMLTTAAGAQANGLHNAVYTELFAVEDIDGGLIPTNSGVKLTSYKELKRREFLENATERGGLIMLFTLMSLLGFSAYFSGIGIKVRQRSYEISVLRSIGTPLLRIRTKLILDGLTIPIISVAAAGCGILAVQKVTANSFGKLELLNSPEYYGTENLDVLQREVIDKFFLEKRLWMVPTEKPLLIILLVTVAVTTVLTLTALRKFKNDISNDLNTGRTKQ